MGAPTVPDTWGRGDGSNCPKRMKQFRRRRLTKPRLRSSVCIMRGRAFHFLRIPRRRLIPLPIPDYDLKFTVALATAQVEKWKAEVHPRPVSLAEEALWFLCACEGKERPESASSKRIEGIAKIAEASRNAPPPSPEKVATQIAASREFLRREREKEQAMHDAVPPADTLSRSNP